MTDVAIFGGGPAGAAAAIALAREGRSVIVFTRSASSTFLVGETLPPSTHSILARLNVSAYFDRCPRVESLGILSTWGSADLGIQDFVSHPGGRGWHVDRKALNHSLLAAAADSGARVVELSSSCAHLDRAATGEWLTCSGPARFLIDASGRTSGFSFPGSPSHRLTDATVSLARHWRSGSGESAFSGWALIEACSKGWCYSAPLPGGSIVASFQADPDWSRAQQDWDAAWNLLMAQLPQTAARMEGAQPASEWRVFSAASKTRSAFSGPGWMVAGDAANACDPLSGSGVQRALRDGLLAAAAVDRILDGEAAAASAYHDRQLAEWSAYLPEKRWYYSLETRWQDEPFWKNRAAVSWEDSLRHF